jgi:hypothetical protein
MKHVLKSALAALGYRVQGTRHCPRQILEPGCLRVIEFDDLVCRRMFESEPELAFIQVGAFDGTTRDPVESETAPAWAGGLASFRPETIVKHSDLIPGLPGMIREETIDCITFDEVLGRLPSERIDLLQIDTEGPDAHILSLFPFDRGIPGIIHWEVKRLSKFQQEETLVMLCRRGYRLARSGAGDMLAVLDGLKVAC